MGLADADTGDAGEEGATTVACSICLETVTSDGDRSTARLQCGHQFHLDQIERILIDEIVFSADGGFQKFLIKWQGRPNSNAMWILEEELRHIDPKILEDYINFSSESSSFQPGGNDRNQGLCTYSRRKCR
ncbi:hypothetical protein COCNU_12G002410 [Cocos nucifera]|uniref:Chromo domain-containing protein n=1 Tax=Cocos nucifera TaxID=13894 RepID=A0A8K0NAF8_COCNU|nr:hypothetical protein COCNU_12G002410 [Cocos nucifera]